MAQLSNRERWKYYWQNKERIIKQLEKEMNEELTKTTSLLQQDSHAMIETTHGKLLLTVALVKKYLCKNATDEEAIHFIKLCLYQNLNPFIREAYLIKYGTYPATQVVGYEVFVKRARRNEKCKGFNSWICNDAWKAGNKSAFAKVIIDGYVEPIQVEVDYDEYVGMKEGAPNKMWANKPKTMLKKVALAQALRLAFPEDLGGMYTVEEINTIHEEPTKNEIDVDAKDITFDDKSTDNPITPAQRKKLFALMDEAGVEPDEVKKFCNVESSKDIPQSIFDEVIHWLEKRKGENIKNGDQPITREQADRILSRCGGSELIPNIESHFQCAFADLKQNQLQDVFQYVDELKAGERAQKPPDISPDAYLTELQAMNIRMHIKGDEEIEKKIIKKFSQKDSLMQIIQGDLPKVYQFIDDNTKTGKSTKTGQQSLV